MRHHHPSYTERNFVHQWKYIATTVLSLLHIHRGTFNCKCHTRTKPCKAIDAKSTMLPTAIVREKE
jgi:hypothetical protein